VRSAAERGRSGDHLVGDGADESAAPEGDRVSALAAEVDGIDLTEQLTCYNSGQFICSLQ